MVKSADAARVKFGAELRKYREHTGLSQKELARAIPLSQAQVSSIEVGSRGTTEEQITRIDQVLGTNGSLITRWKSIFGKGSFPPWFADAADLQARATQIFEYQIALIPGLLQTQSYAEALIRIGRPTDSDEEVKRRAAARVHRQELLDGDHPPAYVIVLDEPWLHRVIGSPAIMKEQLDRLVEASYWPRITIQVIPTDTHNHAGTDGPFLIVTVPDQGEFVSTETRATGSLHSDPAVINDHKQVFGALRGAALPEGASRALITEIGEEISC